MERGCYQSVTSPKYRFGVRMPHHFFRSVPLVIRILLLIGLLSISIVTTRFVREIFPGASELAAGLATLLNPAAEDLSCSGEQARLRCPARFPAMLEVASKCPGILSTGWCNEFPAEGF
jgi:hypothetical protein